MEYRIGKHSYGKPARHICICGKIPPRSEYECNNTALDVGPSLMSESGPQNDQYRSNFDKASRLERGPCIKVEFIARKSKILFELWVCRIDLLFKRPRHPASCRRGYVAGEWPGDAF